MNERFLRIERRDFLKIGLASCVGLILPGISSCSLTGIPAVGDKLSAVTLSDLAGNNVILPVDVAGKVAVIHFWARWCRTCRGEMTALESVSLKYRQEGVVPYSIGIGEKRDTALAYIKDLHITYPILLDPKSATQRQFGIAGIPTYYVLDRDGIIRLKILGEADKTGWDKIIRTLL